MGANVGAKLSVNFGFQLQRSVRTVQGRTLEVRLSEASF